jgi:hypothetical protein
MNIIYITFEHGLVGVVSSDSSIAELVTHCGAIVLNGTGPTSALYLGETKINMLYSYKITCNHNR